MLPVFLVGGFAPQLRDSLGMTTSGLAVGVALFFATSAVTSAPLGRLVERAGLRPALVLLTVVGVGGLTATATVVDSATGLYAALAAAGVANACASSTVNALLSQGVRPERLGTAFGVKQASIPTATLLTGVAIPPFASGDSWHYVYVVAAVCTAVAGITAPAPRVERSGDREQQKLVDVPRLLLFAAVGAVGAGVANAFAILLVDFAISEGYSQEAAGHLLLVGSLVGIAVRLSAGVLVDSRQFRGILGVGALMGAGGFGFLLLAGFGGYPALLTLGVALGFGAGWGWPGLFHYAVARTNPFAVAKATGMVQAGVYAGCVAGPLCVGYLAAGDCYQLAWFGSAAAMLVCGAVCIANGSGRRAGTEQPVSAAARR